MRRGFVTQNLKPKVSDDSFKLMAEGVGVGLWQWPDVSVSNHYWSSKFYQMLGYENEEIEASTEKFEELLHPDDKNITSKIVNFHF